MDFIDVNNGRSLTGQESEQDVFPHGLFAAEAVPVEKRKSFFSADALTWWLEMLGEECAGL